MQPEPPNKTFSDKLLDAARVEETGMSRTFTDGQLTELRDWLKLFMHEHALSYKAVGRMLDYSVAALSTWMKGEYRGDSQKLANAVHELRGRPAPAAKSAAENAVATSFVRDIWAVIDETVAMAMQRDPRMAVITGDSGCGKSIALQGCARRYTQAVYIEITEECKTPSSLLHLLARKLGIRTATRQSAAASFGRIVEKLHGSFRLLIFDEVHHGRLALLNAIRQIMDATGCPIVLAGQPELETVILRSRYDRSQGGTVASRIGARLSADDIVALRDDGTDPKSGKRRLVCERQLLHTPGDVEKLLANLKIRIAPAAMQLCLFVANSPGGGMLRTLVFVLRRAQRLNPATSVLSRKLVIESLQTMLLGAEYRELVDRFETDDLSKRIAATLKEAAA